MAAAAGLVRHLRRAKVCARVLSSALDAAVIGQEDVKEALVLGLVAREHVYVEGPPGVG